MDPLVERIRAIVEAERMSIPAFAAALGEKAQRIKDILRGQSRVPQDLMVKIPETFKLRPEWWLYGRGDMFHPDRPTPVESRRLAVEEKGLWGGALPAGRATFGDGRELITGGDGREFVLLPRYQSKVGAGAGSPVQSDQIVDYFAFSLPWFERNVGVPAHWALLVEVHGDSNVPDMEDGDLLIVDTRRSPFAPDSFYVLLIGDALRVKKVRPRDDGSLEIRSSNDRYGVEVLTPEQAEAVITIGIAKRRISDRRLP